MSLDETIFEVKSLKQNLKKSKKKQMRFGFCKGKKPEAHKWAMHEKMPPKKLSEFAKSNGETSAVTLGFLETSKDNVVTITYLKKCEGLAKAFRQVMKLLQLNSWDLKLIGPDGEEELDQDDKAGIPGTGDGEGQTAPTEDADQEAVAKLNGGLQKARKDWSGGLGAAAKDLGSLKATIAENCQGMPGAAKVDKAFGKLANTLKLLDNAMKQEIKEGTDNEHLSAKHEATRRTLKLVDRLQGLLEKDPVLSRIDDNPFQRVAVRGSLEQTLSSIRRDFG